MTNLEKIYTMEHGEIVCFLVHLSDDDIDAIWYDAWDCLRYTGKLSEIYDKLIELEENDNLYSDSFWRKKARLKAEAEYADLRKKAWNILETSTAPSLRVLIDIEIKKNPTFSPKSPYLYKKVMVNIEKKISEALAIIERKLKREGKYDI